MNIKVLYIIWLLFLTGFQPVKANFPGNQPEYKIPFCLFKTTSDTLTFDQIETVTFCSENYSGNTHPDDIYWMRLDLSAMKTIFHTEKEWHVDFGNLNRASVFFVNNSVITSQNTGSFETGPEFTGLFSFTPENLIEGKFLYIKFSRLNGRYPVQNQIIRAYPDSSLEFKKRYISRQASAHSSLTFFFLGAVVIMLLMASLIFIINRKKEYLYYWLYVFCLGLLFGRFYFDLYQNNVGNFSFISFLLNNSLEIVSIVFYICFVKHYLNTKKNYPLLNSLFTIMILFLIVFMAIDTGLLLSNFFALHLTLLDVRAFITSAFVLLSVAYLLLYRKDKLVYFIVGGSLAYSAGSILVFSTGQSMYLKTGILLEIVAFGLGLGYKIKLEYLEKISLQEELIHNYIKMLRVQMNPHFIFNSLSAVQHLVLQKNTANALRYLSKFSKLMRYTLESSTRQQVLLSEEIQFLTTYIELESLRFDDSFHHKIEISPSIDPEQIEVPLLLIQPFIENAIIHGLLPKTEGTKELSVRFEDTNNSILCVVEDNGIGRTKSKELRESQGYKKQQSMGLELSQKRLQLFEKQKEDLSSVRIEDLIHNGIPSGTRVYINIPKNKKICP